MLAGAIVGGMLGAAFDQVTVTISPAYFVLGKGLSVPPADLRAAAGWLGFRGGLALGALTVGGGLWLEARGASVRWSRLVLGVCASALGSALVVAALMNLVDPSDVHAQSAGVLDESEASGYLTAWGAHMGAYAGVVAGVTAILARARLSPRASRTARGLRRRPPRQPGGRHRTCAAHHAGRAGARGSRRGPDVAEGRGLHCYTRGAATMSGDLTIKILREIRDGIHETNTRLDETNARMEQGFDSLSRRLVDSELRTATALVELAGSVRDVTDLLRSQHDLRPRVEKCEAEIGELKKRLRPRQV